jgi:hypothetical protein
MHGRRSRRSSRARRVRRRANMAPLDDRDGDGSGLRVLRHLDEMNFHWLLHRGEMPRRLGPTTLQCSEGRFPLRVEMLVTPRAPSAAAKGAVWLIVADRREVLRDAVADVGPALDHLFRRRPILGANLAGAEDVGPEPPGFDVFDTLEQAGVFASGFVDAAHLLGVGGMRRTRPNA